MKDYIVTHQARRNYTCTGCGETINMGLKYLLVNKPFTDKPKYHVTCLPQKAPETIEPTNEPKTTETTGNPVTIEAKTPKSEVVEVPKVQRPRNALGHFVKVY